MSEAQKETEIPSEYLLDLTKGPDNSEDAAPAQKKEEKQEDQIPDKYRGKTALEIIEMHRNAESELGRARNEIGQVRRLADELLGLNRAHAASPTQKSEERKKLTSDDLLADPETAVVSVVRHDAEARERAQAERMAALEHSLQLDRFERSHPNYQQTMEDPKFIEWVQKSPFRVRLAQAAIRGDFSAAGELFNLFDEVSAAPKTGDTTLDPAAQARKAGLARPSGGSTAGAVQQSGNKQIWNRAKLMEMRLNNPEEFERLQPEILKAYAEKRVR